MKILTPSQMKSISFTPNVNEICQPLFQYTDITKFSYARIYDNGGQISLATRGDWLEHYFIEEGHVFHTYLETPEFLKTGFILWTSIPENNLIRVTKECFDIESGISLIINNKSFNEIFNFGSVGRNTKVNNWYINNMELIEKFCLYFKDRAHRIINNIDPIKNFPNTLPSEISKLKNKIRVPKSFDLKHLFEPKHVELNLDNCEVVLTGTEYRCLKLLMSGHTAKSIAKQMLLSSRTIESHINNIKKKLHCNYKSDLVKIFHEINMIDNS